MSNLTYRSTEDISVDTTPSIPVAGQPQHVRESTDSILVVEKPADWIVYKPRSLSTNWRRELSEGDATTEMDAFKVDFDPKVSMMTARYHVENSTQFFYGYGNVPGSYVYDYIYKGIPSGSPITPFWGYEQGDNVDPAADFLEVKLFRRRCLEDFSARLARNYELQGVTFLAELHKSRDLLRRPTEFLAKDVTDWAKKASRFTQQVRRDPKQYLRTASDLYLEGQFGWKPLMADIHDIATVVKAKCDSKRSESTHHQHRELKTFVKRDVLSTSGSVAHQYGLRVDHSRSRHVETSIKYSAAVRIVEQTELENRLSSIGFLPQQLPGEIWEFTRLSFILDYFYNIQNVLEFTPDLRHRIRYSSCTYSDTLVERHEWYKGSDNANSQYQEVGSSATIVAKGRRTKRFKDKELGSLIVPSIRVPSKVQLVNLGALAVALSTF